MLVRLLLAALAAASTLAVARAETVLRCVTETDAEVSRRICTQVPVSGEVTVELPPPPPPVVTDAGRGLALTMPPPPPAPAQEEPAIASAPTEAAPDAAILALPLPEPPPALSAIPAPPAAPEAPARLVEAMPPMPPEALEGALRQLRSGNRLSDRDAEEVMAFYRARDFRPLWLADGRWGERGLALRALFAAADDDGLDPARYRTVSAFVPAGEPQWPALAAAEVRMSEAAVLYARDAAVGRVKPGLVHPLITPRLRPPSAEEVLRAADAADPAAGLRAFHPPHPQYALLREALAHARANRPAVAAGEVIPDGPLLRVGMRDPRVPLIRARLGLGYDSTSVYDREVSIRVATLQRANGLPVNGAFTPQTRRVLAGEAPTPEEAEIIANMEFWRWMPRDLGDSHILVNAPAYEMRLQRDGKTVHEARIIIGKAETQTPFFSDEMDHIVVNPSWYIPPGILKREPKYLDPAYASARGYEIRTSRNGFTTVRVPPSSSNALGYVKFMFPNEHSVYLHDTPNRSLFNARVKTLSNGCVRVENPMRLAALLFEGEGFTEERFRRMQGGGERRMNLARRMPVHLGYFTMSVGPDGTIERHPDVYGHAARLRQLMNLS